MLRWIRAESNLAGVIAKTLIVTHLQMKAMPMPDSRMDPHSIRWLIGSQAGRLDTALRQMLFEETPSARR